MSDLLSRLFLGVLAFLLAVPAGIGGQEEPPCGIAPRAKPRRIKGGEGIPPLPLPATPLRRSERKRDPAPPLLIGKLRWGRRDLTWTLPDGRTKRYGDWNHDPNDVHRLLRAVTGDVKTKYRADELDLAGFPADPAQVPILYATGSKALELAGPEVEILRAYLLQGGFFLAVSHHGSEEFSASIRRAAERIFPDRPMRALEPDHPLFRSHHRLQRVEYTSGTRDRPEGAPYLEAVLVGCRAVMVLSPYDLCCEWDSSHLPETYPGVRGDDAFKLGVNIAAYAMAYYPLGRFYAQWGLVALEDPEADRGDFIFAQVRHRGHYDPNPTAFAELLGVLVRDTTLGARFQRKLVALSDPDLLEHPFLYLTGHGDFQLSESERAGLRTFLARGGFLLADSCCGNLGFDLAFRREIRATLPEASLEPIAGDHPVYSSFFEVSAARYTTAVRAEFPDLKVPFLEGVSIDGATRVLYSRFDLGNGWEGEDHPFALGYDVEDARRIGVNAVLYSMTN